MRKTKIYQRIKTWNGKKSTSAFLVKVVSTSVAKKEWVNGPWYRIGEEYYVTVHDDHEYWVRGKEEGEKDLLWRKDCEVVRVGAKYPDEINIMEVL